MLWLQVNVRVSLTTAIEARRESNVASYANWAARPRLCCKTNSNLSYAVLCLRIVGHSELHFPTRNKNILFFCASLFFVLCSLFLGLILTWRVYFRWCQSGINGQTSQASIAVPATLLHVWCSRFRI